MLDIDALLLPVTPDEPGGPNMEYKSEFAELERTALGKPERRIGEAVIPAEDPDWGVVIGQSTALLKASKDLRVAGHLARALFSTHAFPGLAQGLGLVRQLTDKYWSVCHPRLDAEDDHDPTFRVNAMAWLTHRDMLLAVRAAPLIKSKVFGIVTLRDVEAARAGHGEGTSGDAASVEAAFQEIPLADLADATHAATRCIDEVRGLEAAWMANLSGNAPDFAEIKRVLAQAAAAMKSRLEARQATPRGDGQPATDGAGAPPIAATRGDVHSRHDVVHAIDGICAYYARHEPSSPVPLLLERCKRLVTMSFLDIVKDMLPDGLSAIETIAGKPKH